MRYESNIHWFADTGEAYDATQCDESVHQGDILVIPSEQVVGVAYTWPIAVTFEHGNLHTLLPGNLHLDPFFEGEDLGALNAGLDQARDLVEKFFPEWSKEVK